MDGSIWEVPGEMLRGPRPLFFVCFFEPFFYPPRSILGWFWEAKTAPKIEFLGVLFRMRFFIVFLSIFGVFFSAFEVFLNVIFCCIIVSILLCAFFENVDFASVFTVFRGCWLSLAKMLAH